MRKYEVRSKLIFLSFLPLFFVFAGYVPQSEALLYDYGFETGNTSEFNVTVPSGEEAFVGSETAVVRKGRYSGRMSLTLLTQRAYVEKILNQPVPEIHVKCALRLGDDLEIFSMGEVLSLIGAEPETPVASVVLDEDFRLSLAYYDLGGNLVLLSAAGIQGPLQPGTWYDIELHYRSGFLSEGPLFELYIQGVKTLTYKPGSIQSLTSRVCYGQRMEWMAGTKGQGTVYYDICKGSRDSYIGQEPDKVAAVLVDRSAGATEAYNQYATERVKGFLDHVGLPYLELDIHSIEIVREVLQPFDLIILGQEGLGGALGLAEQTAIAEAVYSGVGLYGFDPWLERYEAPQFQGMLGNPRVNGMDYATSLDVPGNSHFITELQPEASAERQYDWSWGVPQQILTRAGSGEVLVVTDKGPALMSGGHGKGRFATWLVLSLLWDGLLDSGQFLFLGHLHGADDLIWRGLVWACRKPMA